MTRSTSESIAETVAVLALLFAPMLGGAYTLLAVAIGLAIIVAATRKKLTPASVMIATGAFAIGLVVAFIIQVSRMG